MSTPSTNALDCGQSTHHEQCSCAPFGYSYLMGNVNFILGHNFTISGHNFALCCWVSCDFDICEEATNLEHHVFKEADDSRLFGDGTRSIVN